MYDSTEYDKPKAVAGCLPNGFSDIGQVWGNPLYQWDYHKKTGYEWWLDRIEFCFTMYDVVRIDHFRGFDEYYSIPFGEDTAIHGRWEKGPGIELFKKMEETFPAHEIIAEDLGYVTDSVRKLVEDTGYPGMKVLEFAFDSRDTGCASDYLPHNYSENSVAYTGTHDNGTIVGWFQAITDEERQAVRDYICNHEVKAEEIHWPMICASMRSSSRLCIIPMQDYLGLGDEARMNTPSTSGNNWKWRLQKDQFSKELIEKIAGITKMYGR